MNLDELRTVQRTERQKDSLQPLRESFYVDVADYIQQRKDERERAAAAADDPFASPEVRRLTDEIQTAEELVEAIYERRVGKVVKRASFAAAGMSTDETGLTSEERELFADLVARIERNRETVLATLAGETASGSETPAAGRDGSAADGQDGSAADASEDPQIAPDDGINSDAGSPGADPGAGTETSDATSDVLADAMGGDPGAAGSSVDPPTDGDESTAGSAGATDRVTLRITRDVGAILGVDDREYDLAREDVVRLPAPNAEPLIERDAAERLD